MGKCYTWAKLYSLYYLLSFVTLLHVTTTSKAQITVTDAHYCSPGKATFSTSDAGCATYKWIDRQGTLLATGCTFTTPFIGLDQSYTVVSSGGAAGTIGYSYGAAGLTGLTSNTFTTVAAVQSLYITNFQINSITSLNTVDVTYTSNMNFNCDKNVVLTLKDNLGAVIGTYSPTTLCGSASKHTITVNIGKTLSPGNYSITVSTPASFYDEGKPDMYTGGANYTPGGPLDYGFMRFTGNGGGGNAWGGLYNWNVSNTTTSKIVNAIDDCSSLVCNSVVAPLVNFDFGSGSANPGGALPAGVNSYNYESVLTESSVGDGDYTILKSNAGVTQYNTWHSVTQDHTNRPNGYYMLVNASYDPGIFYQSTVNGLCDGTYYVFSASIMNVLKPTACGGAGITPNVKFTIKDLGGAVLNEFSSGNIAATATPQWSVQSFNFFLPPGNNTVQLILSNSNPGGCGNDLLLDDILFSPCFPDFEVDDPGTVCVSNNHTLNVTLPSGYSGAQVQWEKSEDGGNTWTPIDGATSNQYLLENLTLAQNGQKYRLGLQSALGGGTFGCPLKSKPATITVEDCSPLPVEFLYFDLIVQKDNSAMLQWTTAEEKKVSYFSIERSTDGRNFSTIGYASPSNDNLFMHRYQYYDYEQFETTVYYRIVEYDFNGITTRTPVKAKYAGQSQQDKTEFIVFPNPSKGVYNLIWKGVEEQNGNVHLSLSNINGQEVYVANILSTAGSMNHQVNITSLPAGIYMLKIESETGVRLEKIIKE